MATLDELAQKYGTDKASHAGETIQHGYAEVYDCVLTPIRNTTTTVLEIGIAGGHSLWMWEAYFPNARIIGLDNNASVQEVGRLYSEWGDQGDYPLMQRLAQKWGPFDLVVDDGGHAAHLHVASFAAFWPKLRLGGFYAIEDMDVTPASYVVFGSHPWKVADHQGLVIIEKRA